MPPQDALDNDPHLSAHILSKCPVDGNVLPDGVDQLTGDAAKSFISKHGDGAIIRFQRVIEGEFVVRQPP